VLILTTGSLRLQWGVETWEKFALPVIPSAPCRRLSSTASSWRGEALFPPA
jgi:hypothetical protein